MYSGEAPKPEAQDPAQAAFERTATKFGIPRENWEHPTVKGFVETFNELEALHLRLSHLATDHDKGKYYRDQDWVFQETPESVAQHRGMESVPLRPSLYDRFMRASHALIAPLEILQEGFVGHPARPDYMKSKLNAAVGGYGLKVVDIPKGELPPPPKPIR
jgi:hypothetical protein